MEEAWVGGMREEAIGYFTWVDGKTAPIIAKKPKAIVTEVQYSQSAGEARLEKLADQIRREAKLVDLGLRGYPLLSVEELISFWMLRLECEAIRDALYHRRTV